LLRAFCFGQDVVGSVAVEIKGMGFSLLPVDVFVDQATDGRNWRSVFRYGRGWEDQPMMTMARAATEPELGR
jgi:hypothetical protein